MTKIKSGSNLLILIVAALLVLSFLAILVVDRANKSRSQLPIYGQVPPFEFEDRFENRFGMENLKGKINVIDFIFTRCKGPCPTMAIYMSDLYQLYSHSDKVQFVSISVDPAYDTPEILRQYARQLGVNDNRWRFIRNDSVSRVAELCEGGFMLAADDLPGGHTTKFILVDHLGRIRSYHDGTDETHIRRLKENIMILAKDLE